MSGPAAGRQDIPVCRIKALSHLSESGCCLLNHSFYCRFFSFNISQGAFFSALFCFTFGYAGQALFFLWFCDERSKFFQISKRSLFISAYFFNNPDNSLRIFLVTPVNAYEITVHIKNLCSRLNYDVNRSCPF